MFLLTTAAASPFALSRWADFFANFGEFAKGFLYTLGMSFCALLLAFVLGVIFGAMSSSKSKVLKAIARVYVEVFQNTPLLVQFVFVYYGLAIMTNGLVMISTFFTAVLCVGIYHGAYIAEVIRSGIEAVPKGQTEAALSQGFTYSQTMSLIILPQAVRTILPPLTNQVVNLIKKHFYCCHHFRSRYHVHSQSLGLRNNQLYSCICWCSTPLLHHVLPTSNLGAPQRRSKQKIIFTLGGELNVSINTDQP